MNKRVTLQTASGELVHEAGIPGFVPTTQHPSGFPDVILWGTRTFSLQSSDLIGAAVYRECFGYRLP